MGLAACRDKGRRQRLSMLPTPMYHEKVGSKDSAAVKTLVTMFMDRMKSVGIGFGTDAAALAKADYGTQGLSGRGFIEFMKTYRQFPVANYTLEYIKI